MTMFSFIHAQFYSKCVYNTAEPNNIDGRYLTIYLFIYDLFNNAIKNSDYAASI
jgi:hypothetical protein